MSGVFTSPYSAGVTWQTLLDELLRVYSEHRQVLGQSAYTLSAGKDVSARSYWVTLQKWLEGNCVNFVHHNDAPNMFSLATWRAAAGLNANGFRRAVAWDGASDPEWAYGFMQTGDVIGPWVFEDIQKGLDALRWTRYGKVAVEGGSYRSGEHFVETDSGGPYDSEWAEVKAEVEAQYSAGESTAPSNAWCYSASSISLLTKYHVNGGNMRSRPKWRAEMWDGLAHSAELWIRFQNTLYLGHNNPIFDAQGEVFTEDAALRKYYEWAEEFTSFREQIIGSATAMPTWCVMPERNGKLNGLGYTAWEMLWLLKWDGPNGFSYTL